jgi:peptidoglycan/LPS O-acetylase OafA/YrhL
MGQHDTARLPKTRLGQIDALRGLAALAVVLFHYTARFVDIFNPASRPIFEVRHGGLGVNLFFIISGFVIFMTLERTKRPLDFVVSRFSRLFPSYWVAIIITFAVTHWLGLPGKLVDIGPALGNFLMIHNLFGIPNVDGAYWTLEVELLFYFAIFSLFSLGKLDYINWALLAVLALKFIYLAAPAFFGFDLPWIVYRLLILHYIPWFALGICIFQLNASMTDGQPARNRTVIFVTVVAALLALAIGESIWQAILGLCLGLLVHLCARGRLHILNARPFLWLGSISYPLYLLHENIGWSIQLQVLERGASFEVAVVLALAASLAAAALLTKFIEQPALRRIRAAYATSGSRD